MILSYCPAKTSVVSCGQFGSPQVHGRVLTRDKDAPLRARQTDSEAIIRMEGGKACSCEVKRIEWTGAGGDYFLGVVVGFQDEVIGEFWGTRQEIRAWMETCWPELPAKYVPMVYCPSRLDRPNKRQSISRPTRPTKGKACRKPPGLGGIKR